MALHYLYNRYNENGCKGVLVITTNSVKEAAQFQNDWFSKLPFTELGFRGPVAVVNNHHSHLGSELHPMNYGLVIIDEAHKFRNEFTDRYSHLTKYVRAEKVVFLTATPIARDQYVSLFSQGEIDKILSKGSQMGIDMRGSIRRHCFMGPYTLNRDLGVWPDLHKLKKEFREPVKEGALADLSAEECDLLNKNVLAIKRRLPFSLLCDEIASYYRIQDGGALSPAFSQGITQKDSERIYLRMKYFRSFRGSARGTKPSFFLSETA